MRKVLKKSTAAKLAAFLICAGVVVAGAIVLLNRVSSLAEGSITPGPTSTVTANDIPNNNAVQGKLAGFKLPSGFNATPTTTSGSMLESFNFSKGHTPMWTLSIQIKPLPSGRLADSSGYQLRKSQPQQYQEEYINTHGTNVVVMADMSGGFNKVAFLQHGDKLATVALSCPSNIDATALQQTLESVVQSWQWR